MEENTNINQTEEVLNNENEQNVPQTEVANTSETVSQDVNAQDNEVKSNKGLIIACLIIACLALVMSIVAFFKKGTNVTETKVKAEKVVQSGNLKIAYINTDTIMAKYQMAVDMTSQLKSKQSSLESSLKNKAVQLQKEEQEYLKTGQNLTLTQQQAKEKEFQKREQELSQAMQQQPAQFQQEVLQQNEKLLNAVLAFVKDYNAKHDKYNIIMSVSRTNGPTLYIDEGMDITDEIVKGLNEEYQNVKKNK